MPETLNTFCRGAHQRLEAAAASSDLRSALRIHSFRAHTNGPKQIAKELRSMSPKPLSSQELTELTARLNQLARNLWWTWDEGAQEIFQELSPRGWQNLYHNAVAVLHEVSEQELRVRLEE